MVFNSQQNFHSFTQLLSALDLFSNGPTAIEAKGRELTLASPRIMDIAQEAGQSARWASLDGMGRRTCVGPGKEPRSYKHFLEEDYTPWRNPRRYCTEDLGTVRRRCSWSPGLRTETFAHKVEIKKKLNGCQCSNSLRFCIIHQSHLLNKIKKKFYRNNLHNYNFIDYVYMKIYNTINSILINKKSNIWQVSGERGWGGTHGQWEDQQELDGRLLLHVFLCGACAMTCFRFRGGVCGCAIDIYIHIYIYK